ncbi:hypothetical protein ACFVZM_25115 [Streptomyces sioyaensis]|uniref:hypothetical protein n=1 Tax=Streptomyces sioyaensis TaxID=67364 RepID=UPI0036C35B86
MKGAGHSYEHPYQAGSDPRWAKSNLPSRQELATAIADVRCKTKSRLVSIWSEVETRRQKDTIRAHQSEFQLMQRAKRRHLSAVRHILSEEHGT